MKTFAEELVEQLNDELKLGLHADLQRTHFARGIATEPDAEGKQGVDKNARVIHGVAVATEGPALGHNMDLDGTFLKQLEQAGNAAKQGIKARFDHPNASSTSMGTAIGRFRRFRKAGPVLRADLHLMKSAERAPGGNYPEYLMELALEDPASFGTSIVFSGKPAVRLNEDGTEQTDEDGKPLPRVARLEKLYAADVVDEPAANPGGLFHALSQDKLAAKITAFLDRYFERKGYMQSLCSQTVDGPASADFHHESQQGANAMGNDKKTEESAATPFQAEKARMFAILKYGRKLGVSEAKIEALMEGADSLDAILMGMIDDAETRQFFNQKTALSLIEREANPSAGGPGDPGAAVSTAAQQAAQTFASDEERWKHEFATDESIREEFLDVDIYLAFRKNEHASKVLRGAAERE